MAESSASPHVALTFSDLDSKILEQIDRRSLGSPPEIIQSSLMSYRLMVVNRVKEELAKKPIYSATELVAVVDAVSKLLLPRWTRMASPSVIAAYHRAYQEVGAGTVQPEMIYALAEQHAERLGVYFNETSQEALAQGFNTLVNQRIPARAAADQALNAYGLTSRQMSGALAMKTPEKVASASPRSLRAKFNEYVGRSLRQRFKLFANQEMHNLDLQAKQTAWMWMATNGLLNDTAEKVWLTAKDEKVCPQCGPMHGKRAGINEKFTLPNGSEVWVAGIHPHCRCDIRVVQLPSELLQKDLKGPELKEFNDEHPRGYHGRFGTKTRTRERPSAELEQMIAEAEKLREAPVIPTKPALAETRPALTSKPTLTTKPALAPLPAALTPQGKVRLENRTLASPMAKLQMKQKIALHRDTVALVQQHVALEQKKPKKNRIFYMPVVQLPKPVYAVMDMSDMTADGKFESTQDMTWTSSAKTAASEAASRFHDKIKDAVNEIQESGFNDEEQTVDGVTYRGVVADEDVWNVVSAVAYNNASGDPDWRGDYHPATIVWMDPETGDDLDPTESTALGLHQSVTYGALASDWGISPEDFEVAFVTLHEGHDSSLGRTYHLQDSRYGDELWQTTGTYATRDSYPPDMGFSVPLTLVEALPDVEMEEFGDHDDD